MNKLILLAASVLALSSCNTSKKNENAKPNVVIIFTDDQGYQDLGCYGSPKIKTPYIDQMAAEGIRFTDFYVSSSVCSPSRASLLTGKLPAHNGVGGVFFPRNNGMASEQITIAEVLKTAGYRTACYGKWHLGDTDGHLPTDQGFDEYFGIPYSNDMYIAPHHTFAANVTFTDGYTLEKAKADQAFIEEHWKDRQKIAEAGLRVKSPLFEGKEIIEYPCNQATLTRRFFDRSIEFIKQSKNEPFFLYITPAMPHIPLYASEQFKGTSERGLYGDVIEEIDWNTGRLLQFLKDKGLDKNTMVIFSSDNGPWLGYKDHAGSAEPLRDGKFTNYEGGVRVPCVMRWPEKWQNGLVSNEIASTMDLLPTIAAYCGTDLPMENLDGMDISDHLENGSDINRDTYIHSRDKNIFGIRKGSWKYMPQGGARFINDDSGPELYDLSKDISEQQNLVESRPDIAKKLQQEIDSINNNL